MGLVALTRFDASSEDWPLMNSIRCLVPRAWFGFLLFAFVQGAIAAPTIWTGPSLTFSKASNADPTLPANQDRLTNNVALTRGATQGMFNILAEASFTSISPKGTTWATDLNNPGDTITATNWAALDFATWSAAYNNSIGNNILNRNAVVHLVDDDVYLDLRFTAFQGGGPGGAFTYVRSTPVPEPTAIFPAATPLVAAFFRRRWR